MNNISRRLMDELYGEAIPSINYGVKNER